MLSKNVQTAALMVVLACAAAVFVLNLAANPQLFDLVLPAIIAIAAVIWIVGEMQQQRQ
ncbi:MAG: hypothetical protein HZC41_24320 [Chloroflexi bacterium]|nr:hypothetical protein [Chloroflexota bacterium]